MAIMKTIRLFVLYMTLLSTFFSTAAARRFSKDKDAVRLEDIKALTFYKDRETTHRRVEALPQLTCTAGSGCAYYEPDSVRCTNSGSPYDESAIEWTCKASLPPEFKLGATEVVCEGYDNPDGPFVLKGSCALEYRLLLTDAGAERYGNSGGRSQTDQAGGGDDTGAFLAGGIFWVIFVGIAGWIMYSLWKGIFRPDGNPPGPRDEPRRGWRGGWDDDDDDAPPPPYTPYRDSATAAQQAKPKSAKQSSSQPRSNRASNSRSSNQQNQQRPWWQPFGAGAAAGGAAGYMAGNMMNSRRERELQEREQRLAGMEGQQARRSWFNSMAGQPARANANINFGGGGGGGRSSFGSNSPSPSFSESRYESTGFGGTRRR